MSYRFNIKSAAYAVLTQDNSTGATYSAVKFLPEIRSIKMSPKVITGEIYGDGVFKDKTAKLVSIDVDFDINKIPLVNRAELLGSSYEDGVMIEKTTDKAPYVAFGFEIEHTDGKSEYVWLFKGKVEPFEDDLKQMEGKIEYGTQKGKMSFIPRDYDSAIRKYADSGATDFDTTIATGWFNAVPAAA